MDFTSEHAFNLFGGSLPAPSLPAPSQPSLTVAWPGWHAFNFCGLNSTATSYSTVPYVIMFGARAGTWQNAVTSTVLLQSYKHVDVAVGTRTVPIQGNYYVGTVIIFRLHLRCPYPVVHTVQYEYSTVVYRMLVLQAR